MGAILGQNQLAGGTDVSGERIMCDFDPVTKINTRFKQFVEFDELGVETVHKETDLEGNAYVPVNVVKVCPLAIGQEDYKDVTTTNVFVMHNMRIQVSNYVQNPNLSWTFSLFSEQEGVVAGGFGAYAAVDLIGGGSITVTATGVLTCEVTISVGQRAVVDLNNFSLLGDVYNTQGIIDVQADGTLSFFFPDPQVKGAGQDLAYAYDGTIFVGPYPKPVFFSWEPDLTANPTAVLVSGTPATYTPMIGSQTHQYAPALIKRKMAFFWGPDWTAGSWVFLVRHEMRVQFN